MNLIEEVRKHRSVSIVGLAKNAGKTETLNYIIRGLREVPGRYAVTSIGVDGETTDAVTHTPKPQITLYPGMRFVTSATHYRLKRLPAEIQELSKQQTALGPLVTAKALAEGKVMLSGPATAKEMGRLIARLGSQGTDTTLIDGALSRLSLGSPSVAEAIVLATGAAVSSTIAGVERATKFIYHLINLPQVSYPQLLGLEQGLWAVDESGNPWNLNIQSAFLLDQAKERLFEHGTTLFASGAVTDKMLEFLRQQPQCTETLLIIRDFTRMFVTPENYYAFIKRGGRIALLRKNHLLAITVNPTSPRGVTLDSRKLCQELSQEIPVPIMDLRLTA